MDIATLWIKRKGNESESPELIVAWDEYSIEENWEGWAADCQKHLDEIGGEVSMKRFLNLRVPDPEIEKYFIEMQTVVTSVSELEDPHRFKGGER